MSTKPQEIAAAAASDVQARLHEERTGDKVKGGIFRVLLLAAIGIALTGLVSLIVANLIRGSSRLDLDLLTNFAGSDPLTAGLQAAIFGSLLVVGTMVVLVIPIAVGSAIYLEEYAKRDRWYNRVIELNIQNLAAVPSIVFGILGLGMFVRGPFDLGFVAFAGSMTLALLVLPTVIVASREAIRAVPSSVRQGALALGATQWQTIWRQVLPASIPGIATGTILAVSRAVGETAPLLLVGATVFVSFNPEGPFADTGYTTLPVQIFNWATRPQDDFRVLAAAGIIALLGILLLMNSIAIYIRNRFERVT